MRRFSLGVAVRCSKQWASAEVLSALSNLVKAAGADSCASQTSCHGSTCIMARRWRIQSGKRAAAEPGNKGLGFMT